MRTSSKQCHDGSDYNDGLVKKWSDTDKLIITINTIILLLVDKLIAWNEDQ